MKASLLQFKLLHRKFLGEPTQFKNIQNLPIVHHYGYVCDLPPGHRFPMKKFHKVYDFLCSSGIVTKHSQVIMPNKIQKSVASLVHTDDYLDKFFSGSTSTEEQRVTGFSWTSHLVDRVRYESGGTLLTTVLAMDRGLACSTAGGTHHAFPERGTGYCLLNDLAIAAQFLITTGKARRVLIVDLDVHQGDGTAFIFKNLETVFTFSMHCGRNFPFRKQESDLDVELREGIGDKEYMSYLTDYLPDVLQNFNPDIVIYDAGVDTHAEDNLGKLKMTDEGLFKRDLFVLTNVINRGIPCATVIGGGYCQDIDKLGKRHTIIHHAALKVWKQKGL
ncbi:Histone deacetylase Rpd3 [Gryllus bimaculatus]|nr:Histone deacetylase Rpd3 [Gryllus bimaculatus]